MSNELTDDDLAGEIEEFIYEHVRSQEGCYTDCESRYLDDESVAAAADEILKWIKEKYIAKD